MTKPNKFGHLKKCLTSRLVRDTMLATIEIDFVFINLSFKENIMDPLVCKLPKKADLVKLLIALKSDIEDDFRVDYGCEDDLPGMQVTIGWNHETGEWSYQTGDNSFMGSAYHYPHWAICYLYRRSNTKELARDIRNELLELAPMEDI